MKRVGEFRVMNIVCPVFEVGREEDVPGMDDTDLGTYDSFNVEIHVREGAPHFVMQHEMQHFIDDVSGAQSVLDNDALDEKLATIRAPWLDNIDYLAAE